MPASGGWHTLLVSHKSMSYFSTQKIEVVLDADQKVRKYNGDITYRPEFIEAVLKKIKDEVTTLAVFQGDIPLVQSNDARGTIKAIVPENYPAGYSSVIDMTKEAYAMADTIREALVNSDSGEDGQAARVEESVESFQSAKKAYDTFVTQVSKSINYKQSAKVMATTFEDYCFKSSSDRELHWNQLDIFNWTDLAAMGLIPTKTVLSGEKPVIPSAYDLKRMNLSIGNIALNACTREWAKSRLTKFGKVLDGCALYTSLLGEDTSKTASLILKNIRGIVESKDDCGQSLFIDTTKAFTLLADAHREDSIYDFCMKMRDEDFLVKLGARHGRNKFLKSQIEASEMVGDDILTFCRRMADSKSLEKVPGGRGTVRTGDQSFAASSFAKKKDAKEKPCFQAMNGSCSYGKDCRFSHRKEVLDAHRKSNKAFKVKEAGEANVMTMDHFFANQAVVSGKLDPISVKNVQADVTDDEDFYRNLFRCRKKEKAMDVQERANASMIDGFILDSGATSHFATNTTKFAHLKDVRKLNCSVTNAHGLSTPITKMGDLGKLKNVKHSPGMKSNLVSVSSYCDAHPDEFMLFDNCGAYVGLKKDVAAVPVELVALQNRQLYAIKSKAFDLPEFAAMAKIVAGTNPVMNMHLRLGHTGLKNLKFIAKRMGVSLTDEQIEEFKAMPCTGCAIAKQKAKPHPEKSQVEVKHERPTAPLTRVHLDIMYLDEECDGSMYGLVFVDASTRWGWNYLISDRSTDTLLKALKTFINAAEQQAGTRVKEFFSDNEPGLKSKRAVEFFKGRGIAQTFTKPGHSKMNGLAENRIKLTRAVGNAMWVESGLPRSFLGYAYIQATNLINVTPKEALAWRTPYEERYKKDFDYCSLRKFGSICFEKDSEMLKGSATPYVFLYNIVKAPQYVRGMHYETGDVKMLHDPNTIEKPPLIRNWLLELRNGIPLQAIYQGGEDRQVVVEVSRPHDIEVVHDDGTNENGDDLEEQLISTSESDKDDVDDISIANPGGVSTPVRPQRAPRRDYREDNGGDLRRAPKIDEIHWAFSATESDLMSFTILSEEEYGRWTHDAGVWHEALHTVDPHVGKEIHETMVFQKVYPLANKIQVPRSTKEARLSNYSAEFQVAEKIEMNTIFAKDVLIEQDETHKRKLGVRFVYDVKADERGNITRFKARLVVQGFDMISMLHYDETWSIP